MHILLYFKAVFLHFFVELKHYWVSTVALCAMMLLLFGGVFVASGGLALTAQNAGYVNEQVIAYLFYYVLSMYFSYFESSIRSKVETGTIEQIIINRMRLIEIVLIEAVVQFFCTIIEGLPVFIVIFIIAKGFLKITFSANGLIVLLFSLLGVCGVGLIMGGLSLRFKRIGQVPMILQILFFGMSYVDTTALPASVNTILSFVPFQKSITYLKLSFSGSSSIGYQSTFGTIIANNVIWFVIGVLAFAFFERQTKQKGIIGYY